MAVNCCGEIAAGDFIIAADIAEDGTIPDGAVGVGKAGQSVLFSVGET